VRTRTIAWSLMTLFFILLGLGVYLTLAVRSSADDPLPAAAIARYVAIGCGIAAALALGIGLLLLYRRRQR
jgi:hypothetical protein